MGGRPRRARALRQGSEVGSARPLHFRGSSQPSTPSRTSSGSPPIRDAQGAPGGAGLEGNERLVRARLNGNVVHTGHPLYRLLWGINGNMRSVGDRVHPVGLDVDVRESTGRFDQNIEPFAGDVEPADPQRPEEFASPVR